MLCYYFFGEDKNSLVEGKLEAGLFYEEVVGEILNFYLEYVDKVNVEEMNKRYFIGRYDRIGWFIGYEYCIERKMIRMIFWFLVE